MQRFLKTIFQQVKKRLCQRRNSRGANSKQYMVSIPRTSKVLRTSAPSWTPQMSVIQQRSEQSERGTLSIENLQQEDRHDYQHLQQQLKRIQSKEQKKIQEQRQQQIYELQKQMQKTQRQGLEKVQGQEQRQIQQQRQSQPQPQPQSHPPYGLDCEMQQQKLQAKHPEQQKEPVKKIKTSAHQSISNNNRNIPPNIPQFNKTHNKYNQDKHQKKTSQQHLHQQQLQNYNFWKRQQQRSQHSQHSQQYYQNHHQKKQQQQNLIQDDANSYSNSNNIHNKDKKEIVDVISQDIDLRSKYKIQYFHSNQYNQNPSNNQLHEYLCDYDEQTLDNQIDYQIRQDCQIMDAIDLNDTQEYKKLIRMFQDYQQQQNEQNQNQNEYLPFEQLISNDQSAAQQNDLSSAFKQEYKKDITEVRQIKYFYEKKVNFPEISFDQYANIRNMWMMANDVPNKVIRKMMTLKMIEKLTYRSFKTLSFGKWLNDEIINGYLELMDNSISLNSATNKETSSVNQKSSNMANSANGNFRILNSFFAETTFAKTPDLIKRSLKRKGFTEEHSIVIALNNGNHWFFARVHDSRLTIYDSIPKQAESYQNRSNKTSDLISNIIKFANWFYNTKHVLEVDQSYPRQQNSFDCGMFLLCGIKDVVRAYYRKYGCWSFDKNDIRFKRIQVAKQLLEEQVGVDGKL